MKKDVIIIGAGITGLTIGNRLKHSGLDFHLFELGDQAGGKIKTIQKDGFICECGPNTVLYQEPRLKQLISDIGASTDLVFANEDNSRNRFILNENGIERLPTSPASFFSSSLISAYSKWRILTDYFRNIDLDLDNASVADYFERRYGKSVVKNIVEPFVTGIYAGLPEFMSFKYSFPRLYELENRYGNIIKGFIKERSPKKNSPKGIFTFKNGLQGFTDRIASQINDQISLKSEVKNIKRKDDHYNVEVEVNGSTSIFETKFVIDTRGLDITRKSIGLAILQDRPLYVPIIVLHLGYQRNATRKVADGFGVLTTRSAERPYLGAIFSSSIFPHVAPQDHDLFTILIGGARKSDITYEKIDDLVQQAKTQFESDMEIDEEPVFSHQYFWDKGIPQYGLNHDEILKDIQRIELDYPGLKLAGNYHQGVSIGDCIKRGMAIAEEIINQDSMKT